MAFISVNNAEPDNITIEKPAINPIDPIKCEYPINNQKSNIILKN